MLDAYTVRKAVPRILIAVIGINLSIYFCVALVDMTNIIGRGMSQLIVEPFITNNAFVKETVESNAENNTVAGLAGGGLGTLIALAFKAPGAAIGPGLGMVGFLFPLIITISLIILAVIFTIIIRQALLLFLIIVSPVAIACFVLPGTEKYFQRWLDLFMKTLLVYPIIAVIFAVSTAMGSVLIGTSDVSGDGIALAKIIGAVLVIYAPLVLIPFAFKFAGGALSAVMNAASGQARSVSGTAGKRFEGWRKDPNSWAGKKALDAKSERTGRGYTTAAVWAGRRRRGMSATDRATAREAVIDQQQARIGKQMARENSLYQDSAQDDLFVDNLARKRDGESTDAFISRRLAAQGISQYNADGTVSEKYSHQRALMIAADTKATRAGRGQANRRQAAMDLISTGFGFQDSGDGFTNQMDMLDTLAEISGGVNTTTFRSLQDEGQYRAKQAGRAELASFVGGVNPYNADGSINKEAELKARQKALEIRGAGYELGQQKPTEVKSMVQNARELLKSGSVEQRGHAARYLQQAYESRGSFKNGAREILETQWGGAEGVDNELKSYYDALTAHGGPAAGPRPLKEGEVAGMGNTPTGRIVEAGGVQTPEVIPQTHSQQARAADNANSRAPDPSERAGAAAPKPPDDDH